MFIFNVIVLMMVIASHGSLSKQFQHCECSMWTNCETATTTNPPCESPWKENNGHCYQFISDGKSFEEASKHCKGLSAELVSIHSKEENDFVRGLVSARYWIGFHDVGTEDNFEWEDGSDSDFTNWQTGEPNDHKTGEDCTEGYVTGSASGKWNDVPCTNNKPFVCKK